MVDPDKLRRILRRVADDVGVLQDYADEDPRSIIEDPERLRSIKYLFVTAIEGCIDAAQHVCASEGWGPPQDNGDAMRVLAAHGVFDEGVSDALARAVGFRNILVHGYRDVDDGVVMDNLDRLGDIERFVEATGRLAE